MIQTENLIKKYPGFCLDVSLNLPEGHVSGIVGKNGAGKSTFIKLLLGLNRPDSGLVKVFDKDPFTLDSKDKERIGVSLAESGFSGYLNINAVIKILKGMYDSFDENQFVRYITEQDLPKDKPIKDFSTGMKAKLKVIIALSHNADLLILDEPTSGLDVIARNEVIDMLRGYMSENPGRSILISSHISSDLEGLCDDIYMINDGKIIFHKDTDVLLSEYGLIKVNDLVFEKMDKQYIIKSRKTSYGYDCLTAEKQYYIDNYPDLIIEKGSIDEIIMMLASA